MKIFRLGGSTGELLASLRVMGSGRVGENPHHLRLAGEWLLKAQSVNGDGGYAHSYSLSRGWAASYAETTGYIIPTMLKLSGCLNDGRYEESALRAGQWLLAIQQPDGSFLDLSGSRQVFDTGQILEGLISLYKKTGDARFIGAASKAGDFLAGSQDEEGTWTEFSYRNVPHTYYTRVSANLLKLYAVREAHRYKKAAEKNLLWAVSRQKENGYFEMMSFAPGELPYLHTIVYVLEGLFQSCGFLSDERIFNALKKTVDVLVGISKNRDSILSSQYDENWRCPKKEKCMTGLAQWAGLLLDIYVKVKNEDYRDQAFKTIHYLKNRQIQKGSENIVGALPGSSPIWGSYFPFSFNNWSVKFLADALVKMERTGE
jgi:hypothetical protein